VKTKHSSAAAENSNSGSTKVTGLDRAEERVKSKTALEHIDANEARQGSDAKDKDSDSSLTAGAKANSKAKAKAKTGSDKKDNDEKPKN
jgi:hypothetical protein